MAQVCPHNILARRVRSISIGKPPMVIFLRYLYIYLILYLSKGDMMEEEIKKMVEFYAKNRLKEIEEASKAVSKFREDMQNITDMFAKSAENIKKIGEGPTLVVNVNDGIDKLYYSKIEIAGNIYVGGLYVVEISITDTHGNSKKYTLPQEDYDYFLVVRKKKGPADEGDKND